MGKTTEGVRGKRRKAEVADAERTQEKSGITVRGRPERRQDPRKGLRVWAAHLAILAFLQHALDIREAAGGALGVHLSSQPLGPDQQFLQRCLPLLSLVQGIQRLLPATGFIS